jgi:hypothetical protein
VIRWIHLFQATQRERHTRAPTRLYTHKYYFNPLPPSPMFFSSYSSHTGHTCSSSIMHNSMFSVFRHCLDFSRITSMIDIRTSSVLLVFFSFFARSSTLVGVCHYSERERERLCVGLYVCVYVWPLCSYICLQPTVFFFSFVFRLAFLPFSSISIIEMETFFFSFFFSTNKKKTCAKE